MTHRLAVYGTLAPGRENHHQLDGLTGDWRAGHVRGAVTILPSGYPGLLPDPTGPMVAVQVFTSPDLPRHWARLDAFEGPDYARRPITVDLGGETVEAQVYVAVR